jgi:hypothetical protein
MRPLPWSHSALSDFNNCPKAFYEKRVAKSVVDPPNLAGQWGDYVHKAFESYLRRCTPRELCKDIPLPPDLEEYRGYLESINRLPGNMLAEQKYAINTQMQPCAFMAPDVWCRSILDVLIIDGQSARVIDHKTGRRKFDTRQLKLNALMVFIHHPDVMVVRTGFMWLKDKLFDTEDYVRANEATLWGEFMPDLVRYKTAFKQEMFVPRQSGLCNGWCPVTSCEFWKPKKAGR